MTETPHPVDTRPWQTADDLLELARTVSPTATGQAAFVYEVLQNERRKALRVSFNNAHENGIALPDLTDDEFDELFAEIDRDNLISVVTGPDNQEAANRFALSLLTSSGGPLAHVNGGLLDGFRQRYIRELIPETGPVVLTIATVPTADVYESDWLGRSVSLSVILDFETKPRPSVRFHYPSGTPSQVSPTAA